MSKNCNHPSSITENNKTITNPIELSNNFNKYFTSVAETTLKERKYEGNKHHSEYLNDPLAATFSCYECDQLEIINIINSLNPRKSVGPNSIPLTFCTYSNGI